MQDSRLWVALLRLAVGGVWLFEGYPQLSGRDDYLAGGFVSTVRQMAAGNPWHFYQQFLLNVILPHASMVAYLTLVGNIVVGVCLFLGLLTSYAGAAGMLLNINYALASGWLDRMNYSLNVVLFFAELLLIAMAAGRVAGIDALVQAPAVNASPATIDVPVMLSVERSISHRLDRKSFARRSRVTGSLESDLS